VEGKGERGEGRGERGATGRRRGKGRERKTENAGAREKRQDCIEAS
jgi:hypothetical protein